MNTIARTITISCFLWMLALPLLGGSRTGRDFFLNFISNDKLDMGMGGVPLIMLILPVLLAGTVCSLSIFFNRSFTSSKERTTTTATRINISAPYLSRVFPTFLQRWYAKYFERNGDGNFDVYAVFFVILPCCVYAISSILRHLCNRNISVRELPNHFLQVDRESSSVTKEIGNSFGMMAMVSMSFFLIPVSKHGPILKLLGWSPARVVRLHIWCGRLIIIGSFLHGLLHFLRYKHFLENKKQSFLFPPQQCWTTTATNDDDSLSVACYDHFLYLTGVVACMALFGILMTSLHVVRRACYSLFYMSHVVLAPIFLLMVMLHYNRGILYTAPSILYYVAVSLPVFQETSNERIKIMSVERLGNGNNNSECCVMSLTIEASNEAMATYRPGTYVHLLAPSISPISHPFTINKVPGRENQLRILFRAFGPFTKELAKQLTTKTTSNNKNPPPTLRLDGYHGCPQRINQLLDQHDLVILIAGGIGITPFLSLLTDIVQQSRQRPEKGTTGTRKKIILHWICRDVELIRYVRQEYLNYLLLDGSYNYHRYQVDIVIHQTDGDGKSPSLPLKDIEMVGFGAETPPVDSGGASFKPSQFSVGAIRQTWARNVYPLASFTTIAWGGMLLVWFLYTKVQSEDQIWQRAIAPLFLPAFALGVSKIAKQFFLLPTDPATDATSKLLLKECLSTKQKGINNNNCYNINNEVDEKTHLLARSDSVATIISTSSSESDEENNSCNQGGVTLGINHQGRRPLIRLLLQGALKDDGFCYHRPAIFSCGPPALIQDIENFVEEKRWMNHQSSPCKITLYDEAFLM